MMRQHTLHSQLQRHHGWHRMMIHIGMCSILWVNVQVNAAELGHAVVQSMQGMPLKVQVQGLRDVLGGEVVGSCIQAVVTTSDRTFTGNQLRFAISHHEQGSLLQVSTRENVNVAEVGLDLTWGCAEPVHKTYALRLPVATFEGYHTIDNVALSHSRLPMVGQNLADSAVRQRQGQMKSAPVKPVSVGRSKSKRIKRPALVQQDRLQVAMSPLKSATETANAAGIVARAENPELSQIGGVSAAADAPLQARITSLETQLAQLRAALQESETLATTNDGRAADTAAASAGATTATPNAAAQTAQPAPVLTSATSATSAADAAGVNVQTTASPPIKSAVARASMWQSAQTWLTNPIVWLVLLTLGAIGWWLQKRQAKETALNYHNNRMARFDGTRLVTPDDNLLAGEVTVMRRQKVETPVTRIMAEDVAPQAVNHHQTAKTEEPADLAHAAPKAEAQTLPFPPALKTDRIEFSDSRMYKDDPNMRMDVAEISDAIQEAEFWLAVTNYERAIVVLKPLIQDATIKSPVAWLYLFDAYKELKQEDKYESLRRQFVRRFNAYVPAWGEEAPPERSRTIDQYDHLMSRIAEQWNTNGITGFLESLLFDDREGMRMGFDLPAYRDIIFLIALVRVKRTIESGSDVLDRLRDESLERVQTRIMQYQEDNNTPT